MERTPITLSLPHISPMEGVEGGHPPLPLQVGGAFQLDSSIVFNSCRSC